MPYVKRNVLIGLLMAALHISSVQSAIPTGDKTELPALHANCDLVLRALDSLGASLPETTAKALKELITNSGADNQAAEKIQQLLDPHCLIAVTINPESRVKAARGAAKAELVQNAWTVTLVKVHNDGGVTAGLRVYGPQVRSASGADSNRWLDAEVFTKKPMTAHLSGAPIEYVILRLRGSEAGKREATLQFDVGQGTQDLGFRAEVPILFSVTLERGGK